VTATQDVPASQLEKLLDESKLKGEEVMPTLAQRWIDEGMEKGIEKGIEKGYLLDRQEVLIMLLSTRFHLNEDEKQFIHEVNDIEKLAAALKMVVTAQTKEEVLESLQTVVH
jgi:hypothetical protein